MRAAGYDIWQAEPEDEPLRAELIARAEDLRVREEPLQNELGQVYAPRVEAVHRKNATRLHQIITEHGWPDGGLVGADCTLPGWFVVQRAMSEPRFQRPAQMLLQEKVKQGKVPAAQEAYLWDGVIAMYEFRPQRYVTQSLPCADGQYRRWETEDSEHLNERRAAFGMPPAANDPVETKPMPQTPAEYVEWLRGYEVYKAGWR